MSQVEKRPQGPISELEDRSREAIASHDISELAHIMVEASVRQMRLDPTDLAFSASFSEYDYIFDLNSDSAARRRIINTQIQLGEI